MGLHYSQREIEALGGVAVVLFFIIILAWQPLACTAPAETRSTLKKAGYTDIEVGSYAWFACSDSDTFQTSFTAANPTGTTISGTVCCGWLKNCTIRY